MSSLVQIPIASISKHSFCRLKYVKPFKFHTHSSVKIQSFCPNRRKFEALSCGSSFLGVCNGNLKKRVGLVRFNGGDGAGDGGDGGDGTETVRVLTNVGFAVVVIYLTVTGQLGWVVDALVSIWLLAVILPIIGVGAFMWWAGRDIVRGTCPNCGNDFQVFKSALKEELQFCPYCTQPFSVVDDKFVRDPVKFSNQTTTFGQAFNDFTSRSKKGKQSSVAVVDIEAEIKDAE